MIDMGNIANYVSEIFKEFWLPTAFVMGLILTFEYAQKIKELLTRWGD
ncbi:hypothetical protein [Brevibacillus daliensis]|nr:hypothetical protein [Brevibacillus daliensis]